MIETIVAVGLIAIVVTAVTSLLISLANSNKQNLLTVQAQLLAREGIEAVRNMRDSNWLQNEAWNEGNRLWGTALARGGEYIVELSESGAPWKLQPVRLPFDDDATRLFIKTMDNGGRRFTHRSAGNEPSAFSRFVRITPAATETDEAILEIASTVRYGADRRTLSLVTELTNWQ